MVYTQPLLKAFLLIGPLRIHSSSYLVLSDCSLNGLRLAAFCCANPLSRWEHYSLFTPFLFTPTFSGAQPCLKTRPECICYDAVTD
jgi:hypothetical protein